MTDDNIRHVTDGDETAEEVASLVGDLMNSLASEVHKNDLCPQCVLLETLVQTVGALTAAGVPAADVVSAVGEGLAAFDEEDGRASHHLH